jgi:hypothetical protein
MMPQVSSLRERHRDGSATRVEVAITGDASPAEQVDALAVFEDLTRDARNGVRCARCRIDARLKADGLSIADGVMILEDGRVLFAWSADRTMLGGVREVTRRLRVRMYAARAARR